MSTLLSFIPSRSRRVEPVGRLASRSCKGIPAPLHRNHHTASSFRRMPESRRTRNSSVLDSGIRRNDGYLRLRDSRDRPLCQSWLVLIVYVPTGDNHGELSLRSNTIHPVGTTLPLPSPGLQTQKQQDERREASEGADVVPERPFRDVGGHRLGILGPGRIQGRDFAV